LSPDCWVIELVDDWQWLMCVGVWINVGQTRSRKKRRSRQSHIAFFSSKNFSIVFTLDAHSSPTMAVKRERKHSWENLSSRNIVNTQNRKEIIKRPVIYSQTERKLKIQARYYDRGCTYR
jgi:signal transduction histidine kinase